MTTLDTNLYCTLCLNENSCTPCIYDNNYTHAFAICTSQNQTMEIFKVSGILNKRLCVCVCAPRAWISISLQFTSQKEHSMQDFLYVLWILIRLIVITYQTFIQTLYSKWNTSTRTHTHTYIYIAHMHIYLKMNT